MKDDFNLDTLSETWKNQSVGSQFDRNQLRSKLLKKRLILVGSTILEVVIMLVVAWLLFTAIIESWSLYLVVGLLFFFVIGFAFSVVIVKSRISSFRMLQAPTSSWIDFELQLNEQALNRGRYTNYFIYIFAMALGGLFIYEYFFALSPRENPFLNYSFGIVWLLFGWLVNRYQMKKHQRILKSFN